MEADFFFGWLPLPFGLEDAINTGEEDHHGDSYSINDGGACRAKQH